MVLDSTRYDTLDPLLAAPPPTSDLRTPILGEDRIFYITPNTVSYSLSEPYYY